MNLLAHAAPVAKSHSAMLRFAHYQPGAVTELAPAPAQTAAQAAQAQALVAVIQVVGAATATTMGVRLGL
jgi:hypothetical protein